MREADIQNQIRAAISMERLGVLFRANVGEGWTGERIVRNADGSITIHKPRRLKTGLPIGFSDLFGVDNFGNAVFIEVKSATGRLRKEQERFLKRMSELGAYTGVARNVEDAKGIFAGAKVNL